MGMQGAAVCVAVTFNRAVCCSVLQSVAARVVDILHCVLQWVCIAQYVAVCCMVAVCRSVSQCVAVCCSVR